MERAPPPSATLSGLTLSAIAVEVSSSVIVRVAVPAVRPGALAVSTTVSELSATLSLVGMNVNVPVPLVSVAAIVKVKLLIAV